MTTIQFCMLILALGWYFTTVIAKAALLGIGLGGGVGGGEMPKDLSFQLQTHEKELTKINGFGLVVDVNMLEIAASGGKFQFTPHEMDFVIGNTKWSQIISATESSYYANDKLLFQVFNDGNPISINSAVSMNDLLLRLNGQSDIVNNFCVADVIVTASPVMTPAMEAKLRNDCEEKHRKSKTSLSLLLALELAGKTVLSSAKAVDQASLMTSKSIGGLNALNKSLTASIDDTSSKIRSVTASLESLQQLQNQLQIAVYTHTTTFSDFNESNKIELRIISDLCFSINRSTESLFASLYQNVSNQQEMLSSSMQASIVAYSEKFAGEVSDLNITLVRQMDSLVARIDESRGQLVVDVDRNLTKALSDLTNVMGASMTNQVNNLAEQTASNFTINENAMIRLQNEYQTTTNAIKMESEKNFTAVLSLVNDVVLNLNSSILLAAVNASTRFEELASILVLHETALNHVNVSMDAEASARLSLENNTLEQLLTIREWLSGNITDMARMNTTLNTSIAALESLINEQITLLSQNISTVMARTNSILASAINEVNHTMLEKTVTLDTKFTNANSQISSELDNLAAEARFNLTRQELLFNASVLDAISSVQDDMINTTSALRSELNTMENLLLDKLSDSYAVTARSINDTIQFAHESDAKIVLAVDAVAANLSAFALQNAQDLQQLRMEWDDRLNASNSNSSSMFHHVNQSLAAMTVQFGLQMNASQARHELDVGQLLATISSAKGLFATNLNATSSELMLDIHRVNASVSKDISSLNSSLVSSVAAIRSELGSSENRSIAGITAGAQRLQELNATMLEMMQSANVSTTRSVTFLATTISHELSALRAVVDLKDNLTRMNVTGNWNATMALLNSTNTLLNTSTTALNSSILTNKNISDMQFAEVSRRLNALGTEVLTVETAAIMNISKVNSTCHANLVAASTALNADLKSQEDRLVAANANVAAEAHTRINAVSADVTSLNKTIQSQLQELTRMTGANISILHQQTHENVTALNVKFEQEKNDRISVNSRLESNVTSVRDNVAANQMVAIANHSIVLSLHREQSTNLTKLQTNLTQSMIESNNKTLEFIKSQTNSLNQSLLESATALRQEATLINATSNANLQNMVSLLRLELTNVSSMASSAVNAVNSSIETKLQAANQQTLNILHQLESLGAISRANHSLILAVQQQHAQLLANLSMADKEILQTVTSTVAAVLKNSSELQSSLTSSVQGLIANFTIANEVAAAHIKEDYKFMRDQSVQLAQSIHSTKERTENLSNTVATNERSLLAAENSISQLQNTTNSLALTLHEVVVSSAAVASLSQRHDSLLKSMTDRVNLLQIALEVANVSMSRLREDTLTSQDLLAIMSNMTTQTAARSDSLVGATREELAASQKLIHEYRIEQVRLATRIDGSISESLESQAKAVAKSQDDIVALRVGETEHTVRIEYLDKSVKQHIADIDTIRLDVNKAFTQLANIEQREATAKDKLSNLEDKLAAVESTIAGQNVRISEANHLISSQATRIASLEAELGTLRSQSASIAEVNELRKMLLEMQTSLVGHTGKVLEVVTAAYARQTP